MRRAFLLSGFAILLSTAACGSNADEGSTESPIKDPPVKDPPVKDPPIKEPGNEGQYAKGIADPCKTHPLDTGFLNDDICLEPPPADIGDQIHYGPDFGADYSDPDVLEPFILPPGSGDYVNCMFTEFNNAEDVYSNEYHTRARKGTHHVIMWTSVTEDADRRPKGSFAEDCRGIRGHIFFPGTQAGLGDNGARLDVPVGGKAAPENEGHARKIMPKAHVAIETHYVNVTDEPMLAEVWMNVIYTPKEDVKVLLDPIFLIGGVNADVKYGQTQITGVDAVPPPPSAGSEGIRIMGFAAHSHAHTSRVTAWINRDGESEREYVYETYDWAEPLNAQFDTAHSHATVTGMGADKEAAYTGVLKLGPKDTFGWECEVTNDDLPNVSLRFGDGAYDKEMCNIFGFFAPGNGTGMWAGGGQPYIR
jgi:hypothetical protein